MSSQLLLRPLTIPEILDRAIRIYRSHFVLLITIPLLGFVPMLILQIISQMLWYTTQLLDIIQNGILQILVSSALVVAISQAYLTRPPTVGEAYRAASQRFFTAWGASLLMGLAIGLPVFVLACGAVTLAQGQGIWLVLLIALPVAVFLGTRWTLVLPSILLEQLGAQAGLGRSWVLTEGSFWKVFGTSFLSTVLVFVIAIIPQVIITYILESILPGTNVGSLVGIVLTELGLILTTPISVGVTVILYYDLRVRKEGFDLDWQVEQASATEQEQRG